MMKRACVVLLLGVSVGLLTACGGGGSSSSGTTEILQPSTEAASETKAAEHATETFEEQTGLAEFAQEANAAEEMQNGAGAEAEDIPVTQTHCKGDICVVTMTGGHFVYLTAEYEVTESSAATSVELLGYECGEYGKGFCMKLESVALELEAQKSAAEEAGSEQSESRAETDERFAEEGGDGP